MERRRKVRYPLSLGCHVSAVDDPTASEPAMTVNVSSRGLLVYFDRERPADAAPGVGDPARIVLELPSPNPFRGCRLDCSCRVARLDEQAPRRAVAFEIKRYSLRPLLADAAAHQLEEDGQDE